MLSERTSLLALLIVAAPAVALAQPQPGQPGQPGQNPAQTGPTTKPDGVAQQGPKRADLLPTVPVLPPDKNERKAFKKAYKKEIVKRSAVMRIVAAWIITVPATAILAAVLFQVVSSVLR